MGVNEMVASEAPEHNLPLQPTSFIGRDQELVAQTLARVVSVPLAPGAEPVSALVNYFRPRQTLLILDNCEHLLASCATLADALLGHCAHLQPRAAGCRGR